VIRVLSVLVMGTDVQERIVAATLTEVRGSPTLCGYSTEPTSSRSTAFS
jgi:hypothetical protein